MFGICILVTCLQLSQRTCSLYKYMKCAMDTPPDQYSDDRGSYAYTFLLEKRRIELGDDMTHTKQNQEYLQVYIHKKRI